MTTFPTFWGFYSNDYCFVTKDYVYDITKDYCFDMINFRVDVFKDPWEKSGPFEIKI